jgi:hypothetical protein
LLSAKVVENLKYKPVTLNHPDETVTAKNYKNYSVGHVGSEIKTSDEFIESNLIIKDQAGIDAINDGIQQISLGYSAEIDWDNSGDGYNGTMKEININHVALVKKARGGPQLRLGDKKMSKKVRLSDTITVELSDEQAMLIDTHMETIKTSLNKLKDANDELKLRVEKLEAEKAVLEQANKDAKAQFSDSAIEQKVTERISLIDRAIKLYPDLETRGKTAVEIMIDSVSEIMGDVDLKDKSEEYIKAMFDACIALADGKDKKMKKLRDGIEMPGDADSNEEDPRVVFLENNKKLFSKAR